MRRLQRPLLPECGCGSRASDRLLQGSTLLRGLRYSRYAILREVVENEFADEVPEEKREAFIQKLLLLVGNVFSVYDLSDDNFALSSDYDLLYTELTGATVLYLDEYGV